MSNNKQSSVEWFWLNLTDDLIGDLPPEKILKIYELKEQAKAKHEEEIEDAYWEGGQDVPVNGQQCQRYYNETFGGNNE